MINYKLFNHQIEGVKKAIARNGNYAFWWSCGIGKCLAALEVFKQLRINNPTLKMLVFAPKSILVTSWLTDIERFTAFKSGLLKETDQGDILVINYEAAISKNGLAKIMKLVSSGDWFCVCDEASRTKNASSLTSKTLLKLKPYFKHRLVMTATPISNNELEIFTQISFICDILPKSYFQFRNMYAHLERNGQRMMTQGMVMNKYAMQTAFRQGFKYTVSAANREKLLKLIDPYCDWVDKESVIDLPEKIDMYRTIELSAEERRCYKSMRDELVLEIGEDIAVASVALAKLSKLREISSGFVYDAEGKVLKIGRSKFNELAALIEELGSKQVIVFAQYRYEIEQIQEMLPNSVTLYSGTQDKDQSILDFKSGKAKYLIGHPKSMAFGHTLTNCSNMIFFSLDYSWESYEQSRNRIHRVGTTSACTYFHLLAAGTIDEQILKVLQKKIDLQEAIRNIIE